MPAIWIDVDTAITVPVNIMPLIDDTDFKSRETGIVYNQAGMDLVWNFQTTGGVTTQTAVTPTTGGGDHDWAHSGDGMYKIGIPDSASSADINNDAEGFGWFSGICDGVLAWRGPVIGFRAAALNNALIDGGDNLDINVVQWLGTTVNEDTAGYPKVTIKDGTGAGEIALTSGKVDGVSVLTGHTPQTGDGYAVVNHADHGNAKLVRATTPANTLDIAATGEAGIDFDNAKGTHPTVPTVTDVTNDVGITQAGADKAWSTAARALTDKAGFSLSAAGILAIWHQLTAAIVTASTIGKLIKDFLDAAISSRASSSELTTHDNKLAPVALDGGGATIGGMLTKLADDNGGADFDATDDSLERIRNTAPLGTAMRGTDSAALASSLATHDGKLDTAQADLDILTGADGAKLATSQPNYVPAKAGDDMNLADDAIKAAKYDESTAFPVKSADIGITQIARVGADGDTLETLSDQLDEIQGAEITDILNIIPLVPISVDLANTATIRLALRLINSLDGLPSTAEITPGTISIERKVIGGTSWSAIVTDAVCLEINGQVYYDEVFDSVSGYAEGDSIRITFKNQKITVDAADYEVFGGTGAMFHTEIRQTMRGTDGALLAANVNVSAGIIESNLKQISDDAQSATDLKDFADDGYDPGTNKVQGVVLVDTTTTNSDMRGTDGANTTKTGYSLSAAGIQAIWDALTSALTTVGSIGKLLVDNINATISSRSSHAASAVWSVGTRTLTSFGTLVQDIWDKATSALTTAGSIGKLLVDNINAAISSRSSHDAASIWAVGTRALTDKANFSLSTAGIKAIWDQLTSALTTAGSIGKLLVDNINAAISSRSSHSAADVWTSATRTLTSFGSLVADIWDALTSGLTTAGSVGKLLVDNINATISSRSSHAAADIWSVGTRTLTSFGTLIADIWAYATRTLSAGVTLTNAGIDAILGRPISNLDATGVFKSLYGAICKLTNRFDTTTEAGKATIYKTDDVDILAKQTITSDPDADPITGVDTD